MQQDIKDLLAECPRCQLTVKMSKQHDMLHPLPQCSASNQRINMDLFGSLKTPTRAKSFVLQMLSLSMLKRLLPILNR